MTIQHLGEVDHIAVLPDHAEYDQARRTFLAVAEPAVVLRPSTTDEVVASLAHARRLGLPLAVRGGGHSFTGFGTLDGGVVLDLHRMDRVERLGGNRVRIGAGATWGPVAATLAGHGLAVTSGDTTSVGVGGLTQAGGIGWMVRKHGLTLDSLVAAELVTAAGEVVRASTTENPELFWGLRGGAGNFGVVTAFELEAQPVVTVRFGTMAFAADRPDVVADLVERWGAVMRAAPDELTTILGLMPAMGDIPAGVVLFVCLAGDDTSALDPLRAIGALTAEDVTERPYASVLDEPHRPEGAVPVVDNTLVRTVDRPLAEAVTTAYAAGGRMFALRSLGGAFGRVDPAATAFALRDAEAMVLSGAFLPAGATEEQVAGARAAWRAVGDLGAGTYAGFVGSPAPEDVTAIWPSATLERLREVKRAWDPDNLFRRNLNIAP